MSVHGRQSCRCQQGHAIRRLPRLAGRGAIAVYRYTLSPLIGFHCRHLPTCSAYGDEAIDRFIGMSMANGLVQLKALLGGELPADFLPEMGRRTREAFRAGLTTVAGVETVLVADVDAGVVAGVRSRFPFLQDRR